jgi:FkbM family methyltransferase
MAVRWSLARAYSRFTPTNRGAFAVARWARKALPHEKWKDVFTTPDGLRLRLDLATYPDCNMALGLYETESIRLLGKLLKPGGHLVDCGANIGYFTLTAAKIVGPSGRVDSFEPSPVNRGRLEEHLKLNAVGNVHVHALAANTENKPLTFHQPTGELNHGQASVFAALVPQGQTVTVQAARIDQTVDRVPDVIKVDVEGAELLALQGAETLLQSPKPPALIIEHNHESAQAAGYRPSDLFRYLQKAQPRYQFFWIGWRLRPIKSAAALDAISRQGNILVRCL